MSNLGLVGFSKRFLYSGVEAPGSTLDAALLKTSSINKEIMDGSGIPDRKIELGNQGNIPLVSVGNPTFPRYPWLLKCYNENIPGTKREIFQ